MAAKILGFALATVLLALVTPATSLADNFTVTFNDTTDSVSWLFSGAGPAPCPPEGTPCTAANSFISAAFTPEDLTFNILESAGGPLSDTLHIVVTTDTVTSTFVSDAEGMTLTPLANATTLIEDGTVQTAASFVIGGPFGTETFGVRFQSDVEPTSTPEPSSISLLAAGLFGTLGLGWRRRKAHVI